MAAWLATWWFAVSDEPDVSPEDALQVAQRALSKVNGLEDEIKEL